MIRVERLSVMNLDNAMRGARNPLNSWARSDSYYDENGAFVLGENDLSLAVRLRRAGSDHRKFLRQVFVSADVTAPLYWWKEFDTYKVGTVANSTSTMHKLHANPITAADFSCEKMRPQTREAFDGVIEYLERLRVDFVQSGDRIVWYDLIQFLPSSYNQMRTCTFNYENLINIYAARRAHKLDEWREFCAVIETLPYARELILPPPDGNGD